MYNEKTHSTKTSEEPVNDDLDEFSNIPPNIMTVGDLLDWILKS